MICACYNRQSTCCIVLANEALLASVFHGDTARSHRATSRYTYYVLLYMYIVVVVRVAGTCIYIPQYSNKKKPSVPEYLPNEPLDYYCYYRKHPVPRRVILINAFPLADQSRASVASSQISLHWLCETIRRTSGLGGVPGRCQG